MSQKVNHGQTEDGQRLDLLDPRLRIYDKAKWRRIGDLSTTTDTMRPWRQMEPQKSMR